MPASSTTALSDYSSSVLVAATASSTNYCKTTLPKWNSNGIKKIQPTYAGGVIVNSLWKRGRSLLAGGYAIA
ncbi:hypothetical protein [Nostoc sp. FACHB-892]|uniref:hypothetical protein n=1 Tax=Nostoc sp. FACHB-892 TaxID=2692843 RepID=UPI001A7E34F8|nr:hypothetical protein [Nostoc sp. FACHB-892]